MFALFYLPSYVCEGKQSPFKRPRFQSGFRSPQPTLKPTPKSVREELAALADKSDEDIDYSDIPATTHEDWAGAVRGKFYRPGTHFKEKED